jgi:hypothetical protein
MTEFVKIVAENSGHGIQFEQPAIIVDAVRQLSNKNIE